MTSASPDLSKRTREFALELTSWPSVTGSRDEARFASRLTDYLSPLFATVVTAPLPGDALGRSNVLALRPGRGRRTILLTGHFDTVPFDDYGDLTDLALDPEPLRDRMIEQLRRSGENHLALADLESGNYLPGRGLLDMKSGLAAGIAAMEAYEGPHNLLLLATPDEEDRSAGMRAGIEHVRLFASDHDLDVELAINLDSISDQGDGSLGQSIAFGSIGKLLLTTYVVGKEAHACYPQDGVNAAYLAAELVTEFELAAELTESSSGEVAAPPTALYAKDLKSGYNVTTPGLAWVYWNTLQHRRTGGEVLDISLTLARRAMDRARHRTGRDVPVITYAELIRPLSKELIEAKARELASRSDLDLPERSKLLTQYAWQLSGRSGPAVVLGFGSIPYPAVSLADAALEARIMTPASAFAVGSIRYFPGISDMSFLGRSSGDLDAVSANLAIWGSSFVLATPAGYPCINIGPWGRDYHHWLERLYTPYAFDALPHLILKVGEAVFDD